MKRKFYGVLMLGALAVASASLTSCKDYDDDINNLQTQVNSLSSAVDQKEAAIKQLIANLDEAYKKADAELKTAYEQADKNLEEGYKAGDVATLAAAKTAIDEAKKALEATIKSNYESLDAKNKEQDIAIAKAQADASNALNLLASKANQSELDALKTDVQKIATELNSTKAELSQISTGLQQAFGDLANLGTALKAQQAALEAVQTLANQNKTDIAANKDAIDALIKRVETAENELKKANDAIAEANKTIEEVRAAAEARAQQIDVKFETITAMISKDLRSLVYMPTLYMDGIETIEYNYLRDTLLTKRNINPWEREEYGTPRKEIAGVEDFVWPSSINTNNDFIFGPAWPVYYHQNPSIANTAYDNVVGYYAYDVETITRATDKPENRKATWGITSPEKYVNGDQLFQNGPILTAGLQIAKPHLIGNLKDNPNTSYATHPNLHSNNDVIVAFQAKSRINNVDTVITSDYAMLYTEKIWLEGLIWRQGTTTRSWPTYWYKDNQRIQNFWNNDRGYATAAPNGLAPYPYRTTTASGGANHDWACPWTNQIVHVWDNPTDALMHPADIELFVNDLDGVDLIQYMGVHFVHESITKSGLNRHPGEWAWNDAELKHFGLQWHMDVIDYTVTDRTRPEQIIRTHDSRYCAFSNPVVENGLTFVNNTTITAKDVIDRDGLNETYDDPVPTDGSRASVGREPLVRVRLFHKDKGIESPILDGYIRVRISQPELKEVEYPAFQVETFDLCNALEKETNWILFNQKVLHDGLDLEREQFNALYAAEYKDRVNLVQYSKPRSYSNLTEGDNGTEYYGFYNETGRNLKRAQVNGKYYITEGEVGTIEYRDNYQGTTNDAFVWVISEAELEFITHDLPVGTEVTIERYVHFTGHFEGNRGAKYDDVFIKLTRTIKRAQIGIAKLKNKDDDYYRFEKFLSPFTGSAETYLSGYEAVAWNAPYPKDAERDNVPAMMTVPFENRIDNAFLDNAGVNKPILEGSNIGAWKYYFSPIEVEITGQDGVVYVLTPRRGSGDNLFRKFNCAYVTDSHDFHITYNGADKTDVANNRSNGKLDNNNVKANETENNKIVSQCAIKYNTGVANPYVDGVFANDTLYAVKKSAYSTQQEYEPIVIMNQTNGHTTLLHESVENVWKTGNQQPLSGNNVDENTYSEIALNAVGYDEEVYEVGQNPIHAQLRAWTGVIAKYQNCNIAMQMSDATVNKKDDNTYATWMNGWERPINVFTGDKDAVDAKNNGNYIYAVDFLKMYDWRGYGLDANRKMTWDADEISWGDQYSRRGAMFGENYWLWAYYGIKGFTFRVKTTDVETTLHWGDTWHKLSEVSHNLEFYAGAAGIGMRKNADVNVPFSLRTPVDYSYAAKNDDLIDELGFNTPDQANGYNPQKAKYGYIFYTNNGDNVQEFYLKVPVRVYYDWGWFDAKVTIKVGGTMGNLD